MTSFTEYVAHRRQMSHACVIVGGLPGGHSVPAGDFGIYDGEPLSTS
jgi:hypothetical protein